MSAENMTTNGASAMAQAISVSDARTFLTMSAKELERLHRNAPEPSADMLSGQLSGNYLTLHTDKQPFTDGICRFFTRFPGVRWAGKSFYPAGDNQGRGKNIISILGGWFRFELISFKTLLWFALLSAK
jgi:hypothetical protein